MAPPLEPAQQFAQSASPLLRVLAGPGTGKSYALTQRLNHLVAGIAVSTHFRDEAISTDKALEALTLLTLLADPDDRLALRAWLAIGHNDDNTAAYRRLYAEARSQDVSVADILTQLDAGDLKISYVKNDVVERWNDLQAALVRTRACADDTQTLIDLVLPIDDQDVSSLRALALAFIESADLTASALVAELRSVVSQIPELPEESDEVRVMTFHGSKGPRRAS